MDVKEKWDENGKPFYEVTSPKRNCIYKVEKTNDGHVFYHITQSKGNLPKELQGFHTRQDQALHVLTRYLETATDSRTVERDKKYAAKSGTKGKQHVQQGAAD